MSMDIVLCDTPDKPVMYIDDMYIDTGAKDYIQNRRDALKDDTTALSEFKRQFPFTVEEAFRNDTKLYI